jgi:hypothetical protein
MAKRRYHIQIGQAEEIGTGIFYVPFSVNGTQTSLGGSGNTPQAAVWDARNKIPNVMRICKAGRLDSILKK